MPSLLLVVESFILYISFARTQDCIPAFGVGAEVGDCCKPTGQQDMEEQGGEIRAIACRGSFQEQEIRIEIVALIKLVLTWASAWGKQ